jgi:hypothetical protein
MCEWCGHQHAVTALCSKRPRWSRRGFLALMGAAAVGVATPSWAVAESIVQAEATSPWAASGYALTMVFALAPNGEIVWESGGPAYVEAPVK